MPPHGAKLFSVALAMISILPLDRASAQDERQLDRCVGLFASNEEACTAFIQAGQGTSEQLSLAHYSRATVYKLRGELARAILDLDHAIRLNPQSEQAFGLRGSVYVAQGDHTRAIVDYTLAIQMNPRALNYSGRGYAYYLQRQYPQALADYTRAIQIGGIGLHSDYQGRGDVYFAQRDYPRAIADYSETIRGCPSCDGAYSRRGSGYMALRDYARAIADFDQAITLTPRNARYLNSRCAARALWGQQLDQALADCNASLSISNSPITLDSRGLVNLRRGDFQAALADYEAAYSGNSNQTGSLFGRGVARLRLGQTEEGQADIVAATARDPNVGTRYAGYGVTP